MTTYGGWGGIVGGRKIDRTDAFEADVDDACRARVLASDADASAVYAALCNVEWTHSSGCTASYSFRAAGDMVAAIRRTGDYLDWYCTGPEGNVAQWIADAMRAKGWTARPLGIDG